MTTNTKWMFAIVALFGLLIVILVPLAFMFGRGMFAPDLSPTTIAASPTQGAVVIFLTATPLPVSETARPAETVLPTQTPLPTSTPLPTNTALPTNTPLPTNTALPTNTPLPTKTPTPAIPCNWAQFVSDVTIPDGIPLAPTESFQKIWRLKNIGTCTWNTDYSLNFSSGTAMTVNNTTVYLTKTVKPGETVDIKVKLKAPAQTGAYSGNWLMKTPSGFAFGIGPNASSPVDVSVLVVNVDPSASYDFILRMCDADWRNSAGAALPCPSAPTGTNGFFSVLTNPRMEHRTENEPALWINPNHVSGGEVKATYPAYQVQNGDHFKAWVGCLENNPGCKITFGLYYIQDNGPRTLLGTWTETYDGNVSVLDIDVSFLAGSDVSFILVTEIGNQKYDVANAFWFLPRITNVLP